MQCRAGDTFVTHPSPLPMARTLSPVFQAVSITLEKTHSPNSPNTIMAQHYRRPAHNWSAQPQRALCTHSPWNAPVPSLPTPRKHHTAPSTHTPPQCHPLRWDTFPAVGHRVTSASLITAEGTPRPTPAHPFHSISQVPRMEGSPAPRQLEHGDRTAPVGGGQPARAPCCGGVSARRAGGGRGEGAEHLPLPRARHGGLQQNAASSSKIEEGR